MGKDTNLRINVTADTVQAQDKLKGVNDQLKQIENSKATTPSMPTSNMAAVAAGAAAAALAIQKMVNAAKEWVSLAAVQQQAETKVNATLKATGNQIGMTVSEMGKLASSLQSVTTFGDETTLGVEQLMVATKAISKEVLPEATELTLDLATAMGTGATEAAKKLAKALADPKTGFEGLRDANIVFSTAEKNMITQLADSGKTLEAQRVILDKVAGTYGGLAREVAATDTGKITQINNLIGDIKEGLGTALVSALGPAFDWLLGQLNKIATYINDFNIASTIDADLANGTASTKYSKEALGQYIDDFTAKMKEQEAKLKKDLGLKADDLLPSNADIEKKIKSWRNWGNFGRNINMVAQAENAQLYLDNQARLPALQMAYNAIKAPTTTPFTPAGSTAASTGATTTAGGTPETVEGFIAKNVSQSFQAQIDKALADIVEAEKWLAQTGQGEAGNIALTQILETRRTNLDKLQNPDKYKPVETPAPETPEPTALEIANDLISKNVSLSELATERAKQRQIASLEAAKAGIDAESDEAKMLDEIIAKLKEVKKKTDTTAAEDFAAVWKGGFQELVSSSFSMIDSFAGLQDQLYENQINALQKSLDEQEKIWDKYFSDLADKYDKDQESLDLKYESGMISGEEYSDKMKELEDTRVASEEEAEKKQEELQAKIDELKKKQFDADKANSITQAVVGGAISIANIWATHGANPVLAGILTGISTAAITAQIATIASQQYTAMAIGGVVTSPTRTLIGEAGPEAVIPLTRVDEFGLGDKKDGTVNISINIGDVYTDDDLSQKIYEGISKAQRTGALPAWGNR